MGSSFDSEVYRRRKHTPWARMDFLHLAHELCYNEQKFTVGGTPLEESRPGSVILTITYRRDVSSRFWYEIGWFDGEGQYCQTASQEFDLLLWRTAQHILNEQEKAALREAKQKTPEVIGRPVRTPDGAQAGKIIGLLYDPNCQQNLAAVEFTEDGPHGKAVSVGYFVWDNLKSGEVPTGERGVS